MNRWEFGNTFKENADLCKRSLYEAFKKTSSEEEKIPVSLTFSFPTWLIDLYGY